MSLSTILLNQLENSMQKPKPKKLVGAIARSGNTPRSIVNSELKILDRRICDLGLDIWNTPRAKLVDRLYSELEAQGFDHFRPIVYLGDEWFSPDRVPAISVPFYLADPKLAALEKRLIGQAEGEKPSIFMKLIRHECGHCFDHAYGISGGISSSREWKSLFGDRRKKYAPDHYHADPDSRDYVQHLPDFYAQSHPDEDFAETFAVWLDPKSRWRQKYRYWSLARKKLEYVDKLAARLGHLPPRKKAGTLVFQATKLRRTLRSHYEARLIALASEFRGTLE